MTRARSKLSAHLIRLAAGGGEEGDEGDDHVLVAQPHRLRDRALINIINNLFMIMITDHSCYLQYVYMDVRTELKGNTCKSNLDFSASTGDSKKQRGRYGREKENNSQSCKMVSISQIFLFRKKEIETVYFNPSRFSPVFVLILSMIQSSQVGIIFGS